MENLIPKEISGWVPGTCGTHTGASLAMYYIAYYEPFYGIVNMSNVETKYEIMNSNGFEIHDIFQLTISHTLRK